MTDQAPGFQLDQQNQEQAALKITGDWVQGQQAPEFNELRAQLAAGLPGQLAMDGSDLGRWDSILMAFLLQCFNFCRDSGIEVQTDALPEGVRRLLTVATTVPPHERPV